MVEAIIAKFRFLSKGAVSRPVVRATFSLLGNVATGIGAASLREKSENILGSFRASTGAAFWDQAGIAAVNIR